MGTRDDFSQGKGSTVNGVLEGSTSGLSESSRQPETTIRRDLSRVSMRRFCENFEPDSWYRVATSPSILGYCAES